MTTPQEPTPDRLCVLPGDPSWIHEARYLDDQLLLPLAEAATAQKDAGTLPAAPYQAAAATIRRLAEAMPQETCESESAAAPPGVRLYVMNLPAWETEALWEVLAVLRRAQAGEPDTADLLQLVQQIGGDSFDPARSTANFIADLLQIVAVLMLDTPAAQTLATALIRDTQPDPSVHEAYEEITAAWRDAGIRY